MGRKARKSRVLSSIKVHVGDCELVFELDSNEQLKHSRQVLHHQISDLMESGSSTSCSSMCSSSESSESSALMSPVQCIDIKQEFNEIREQIALKLNRWEDISTLEPKTEPFEAYIDSLLSIGFIDDSFDYFTNISSSVDTMEYGIKIR